MDRPHPRKITTILEKRRPGEAEPYETDERAHWFDPDGTEVYDPERIMEIEADLTAAQEQEY